MLHGPGETIGEFVRGVLAVDNEQDARVFYECALVACRWAQSLEAKPGPPPEEIVKSNIGWCFGEGMEEDRREMWQRVCDASHPVFGTKMPTPEEALQAGMALAKRAQRVMEGGEVG